MKTKPNQHRNSIRSRIPLFSFLIALAMAFTACYDTTEELPDPLANTEIAAEQRCITDCTQCPQQNCCCLIELLSGDGIIFELCGNFIGCGIAPACGPINSPAPCGTISGVSAETGSMGQNDLFHFCIAGSEDIYIFNTNPTETVRLRVACLAVGPDPVETILVLEPQEVAFLQIDGDCNTAECD